MTKQVLGTVGYSEEADLLLVRYETYDFEVVHADVLHLLPTQPSSILDIGAGTGRDAAYFASNGHQVVAVEPTDALRHGAAQLHPSPAIAWVDDGLPSLSRVVARSAQFDLMMLTAVWMHLDVAERQTAMPVVASLVRPGGRIIFSLRHGPVPDGRRMFNVTAAETIELAANHDLRLVFELRNAASVRGSNQRAGVTWTQVAFERGAETAPIDF